MKLKRWGMRLLGMSLFLLGAVVVANGFLRFLGYPHATMDSMQFSRDAFWLTLSGVIMTVAGSVIMLRTGSKSKDASFLTEQHLPVDAPHRQSGRSNHGG